MNREDIIRMAREAGLEKIVAYNKDFTQTVKIAPWVELERFAALVVAAEREACAVLCETSDRHRGAYFADKIRARGEK